MTEYMKMVEAALTKKQPLKLILKGWVEEGAGIVAVVYATTDSNKARNRFEELTSAANENNYYMVYSVPFDTDLTQIGHYPSIAISKEDFE
jgi:endo-alpha-1,4-polygalactosaminidase (GH114 family)